MEGPLDGAADPFGRADPRGRHAELPHVRAQCDGQDQPRLHGRVELGLVLRAVHSPLTVADQWQNVSISVGSNPGMVNKTLWYFFAGNQPTPVGQFDVMIADITLVRSDGTIVRFPVAAGNVNFGGDMADSSNLTAVSETVNAGSGAVGAVPNTRFYLADQVGTTQMELSSGGWPVWQGWFTPFGQEIVGGGTQTVLGNVPSDGTDNRYKFTGKERDAESGLDYFGARYYASNMGRWMSPDWSVKEEPVPYAKLDDPQSLNLYGYVLNNPLSKADPDGHCCWEEVKGFVGRINNLVPDAFNQPIGLYNAAAGAAGFKQMPYMEGVDLDASKGMQHGAAAADVALALAVPAAPYLAPEAAPEAVAASEESPATESAAGPSEAYNRRAHYGDTPTTADRKAIGGESVDHNPPLVKRYYEGDPAKGEKPGYQQTPAERRASATDRSRMQPSTRSAQNSQGGTMSQYSKQKKQEHGLQ